MLYRTCLFAVAVIAALGLAVSASAQITHSLPMTGQWFQNRGPLVDIPINGGPQLCFGGNNVMTGCINLFRPATGGIKDATGIQSLMITAGTSASDPADFTMPTNAFTQMLPPQHTHVSIIPTVVQLDTQFQLIGPPLETAGPNVDRIFEENAWAVQGHTGRLGLSFAWCPGVGGPLCPDPRPTVNGNTGPENGLVRYSNPGGNAFGGTMAMLTNTPPGNGAIWVVVGTAGGPMNTPLLLRQNFSGMGRQHPGAGYAVSDTDMLAAGPIYLGFMTSNQTALQTGLNGPMNGLITFVGGFQFSAPPDNNTNWGFPWTTGNVFVQDIQTNMGAMATTTISASGTDNRTQAGAGTISLVAGGTSHRVGAVTDFKAFDIVTMELPEPGSALLLGLSLSVIGGLYRLRRRF
jgi:hypothetical protein